jgi:hypothetical protein
MPVDIEETLTRELHEVADGLHIPTMPPLPEEAPRPARHRGPLLAAAAVVLIVAGSVGLATVPDGQDTRPAQPSPSPSLLPSPSSSPTAAEGPIPRSAPAIPYVLDQKLYADGEQVPGSWWSVRTGGEAWIAAEGMPITWWWGRGPEPRELPNGEDVTPKISPNGTYVAVVRPQGGEGILTVIDTRSGRNFGGTPTNFGPVQWDEGAYVVAVTDDGKVVIRRGGGFLVWSQEMVVDTLSGEMVFDATSAGLVVGDVDGGEPYLAEITESGELARIGELPEHDDLTVSPDGAWLAWTPIGTTGGDVTAISSLEVGTLEGGQSATLTAPDGWQFKVRTWAWEDDNYLVSTVTDDQGRERMARCRPLPAECLLIRTD